MQVDRGAVKFILSGANIMCPGLTSQGGHVIPGIKKDAAVAVMVDGKEHAICVGQLYMSSDDIIKINKDIGILNHHYLDDGMWHFDKWE
jgi:PUA domain protein